MRHPVRFCSSLMVEPPLPMTRPTWRWRPRNVKPEQYYGGFRVRLARVWGGSNAQHVMLARRNTRVSFKLAGSNSNCSQQPLHRSRRAASTHTVASTHFSKNSTRGPTCQRKMPTAVGHTRPQQMHGCRSLRTTFSLSLTAFATQNVWSTDTLLEMKSKVARVGMLTAADVFIMKRKEGRQMYTVM